MSSNDGARKGKCAARYSSAMRRTTAPWFSGRPENHALIQTPHTVSTGIDRHLPIAKRLYGGNDAGGEIRFECPWQFLRANLDPGEVIVVTDAAHAKAQLANRAFRTLDQSQLLTRD